MKLLEVLEGVDREAFDFMFGRELTYTTVRSDQRMVELIPNGSSTVVRYEDRKEFIRLVQKARLEESKEQVTPCPQPVRLQGDPGPGPLAVLWLVWSVMVGEGLHGDVVPLRWRLCGLGCSAWCRRPCWTC